MKRTHHNPKSKLAGIVLASIIAAGMNYVLTASTQFIVTPWASPKMPASVAYGAGSAVISLSPAAGSYAAGKTFTVSVVLDSGGGVGVNAADGKITFDPSVVNVVSVSKNSSVFNLWVKDPSFSNANGSVDFSGGSNNAYTGSSGNIFDITLKGVKEGSAVLKFDSADALAADGQGTNILNSTNGGAYTIGPGGGGASATSNKTGSQSAGTDTTPSAAPGPAFTPTVTVSSPTHPDPTKWYDNANPNFTWQLTPDIAGVSTLLDKKSDSYPKRSSEGLISSKQFTGVGEGTSYFHARFQDALGNWSDPFTMAVQIDLTPPMPFTVTAQPGAGLSGRTTLTFNATDTVSGVDHYVAVFDGGASSTISSGDIQGGVWTAPPLLPGRHTVAIFAVDKADNNTEADAQFDISGIGRPNITNFPATAIENSPIVIQGVADSGANVTVDINSEAGKIVSEGKMVADMTGHWLYALEGGLPSGKYSLSVVMVTLQGAIASTTATAAMNVLPAPFLDRFGWALIVLLLCAIAGLIGFGFYRKKLIDMQIALARRENEEAREKTKAVFEALREEMDDQVSHMEGGAAQAQGETKLEPERVIDDMRTALAISETTIAKEIDDVDKALEDHG